MTALLHSPESPQLLTCRGPADLLAALPRITGFVAQDSLFIMLFSGDRARTTLRVDLPADPDPESLSADRLLDFIADAVRRGPVDPAGRPFPAALIFTTSRSFAECGGPPFADLARRVERRLRRDGLTPREMCCLATDAWASYLDTRPPASGRPLELVSGSPIARTGPQEGECWPELESLGEIIEADEETREAVRTELERIGSGHAPGGMRATLGPTLPGHPLASGGVRPRGEHESNAPAAAHFPPGCVATTDSARDSSFPRVTPAIPDSRAQVRSRADTRLAAWIVETARLADELCEPVAQGRGPHCERPEVIAGIAHRAQTTEGWFALAVACISRTALTEVCNGGGDGPPAGGEESRLSALGASLFSVLERSRPGSEHLDRAARARRALGAAIGAVPASHRADLLTLSSWLWWFGGLNSVARRQLDQARRLAPHAETVSLAERLISIPFSAERLRER